MQRFSFQIWDALQLNQSFLRYFPDIKTIVAIHKAPFLYLNNLQRILFHMFSVARPLSFSKKPLHCLHQSHGKKTPEKTEEEPKENKTEPPKRTPENENTESTTAEPPEPNAKAKAELAAKAKPGLNKPAVSKAGDKQGNKVEKKPATKKIPRSQ